MVITALAQVAEAQTWDLHGDSISAFFPDNKDVSVMMSEMDVNAIAGTLKLYFRELPEPLFTDEFYPNFAEGIGEHRWPRPVPFAGIVRRGNQTVATPFPT